MNLAIVAGVGVISGQYIFKAPIEDFYAEEKRKDEAGLPNVYSKMRERQAAREGSSAGKES